MPARFGLPERVHNRAAATADMGVIPAPRFGVDRLAHGAEHLQAREIVLRGMLVSPLHERADRRGRRVEVGHAVARDHLPEAVVAGKVRRG